MDKRYQVFVSSTYSDLKEERTKVMQTIMSMDCIPAGMELFPAMDEEQLAFIKRIIDDCDYYILIIGARYGSIGEDGISYTEKEYDYAKEKGIPIIAFLHDNIQQIPLAKADADPKLQAKLNAFKDKVKQGRLVKFWNNPDDLNGKVAVSLMQTTKTYPGVGWVRANLQTNVETLQELNTLRKEVERLKAERVEVDTDFSLLDADTKQSLIEWEEIFDVEGDLSYHDYQKRKDIRKPWSAKTSLKTIFDSLSVFMLDTSISDTTAKNRIAKILFELSDIQSLSSYETIHISPKLFQTIKLHLKFSKLIDILDKTEQNTQQMWKLSPKGRKYVVQQLCILKQDK